MYTFDTLALIRQWLPPFRRGTRLERMAHALFRFPVARYLDTLEDLTIEAAMEPSAGVIAANVVRILARDGWTGVIVRVQNSLTGTMHDFDVVVEIPMTDAYTRKLQAWVDAHAPYGKRGLIRFQAAAPDVPAPTNLVLTPRVYGGVPHVGISWVANATPSNATGAQVEASTTNAGEGFSLINTVGIYQTTVVDQAVIPNLLYWIRVRNVNTTTGGVSAWVTAGPFSQGVATNAPVLNGQRLDGARIRLQWVYSGEALNMGIFRSLSPSGDDFEFFAQASGSEHTAETVPAARWRVAPNVPNLGYSNYSNVVSIAAAGTAPDVGAPTIRAALQDGAQEALRIQWVPSGNGLGRLRDIGPRNVPPGCQCYYLVAEAFQDYWSDKPHTRPWTGRLEDFGEFPPHYNVTVLRVMAEGLNWWDFPNSRPNLIREASFAIVNTGAL